MIFLISLMLAGLFIALCRQPLKQHPTPFYLAAVALSLAVLVCSLSGVSFPGWIQNWVWPIFSRSTLATALWAVVMWTGALPNGSTLIKRLMPIRGELSILAAILTLGHNAAYGKTYFRFLFTNPSRLPVNQLLAAVCSLIMLCIMLPLFVTSFQSVRKQMKGTTWKKLQRLAYGFYALLYLHVMLLTVPYALAGRSEYLWNVLIYSAVFLSYAACRILKALAIKSKRVEHLPRHQTYAAAGSLALSACLTVGLLMSVSSEPAQAVSAPGQQETQLSEEILAPTDDADATEVLDERDATEEVPQVEAPESTVALTDSALDTASQQTAPEASSPVETPIQSTTQETTTSQPQTSPTTQESIPAQEPTSTQKPAPTQEPTPVQESTPAQEVEPTPEPEPEPQPEPEPVRIYKNGTFSGTGEGFEGPITVSVTIQDDVITAISITASSDDEPYWSDGKTVVSRILSAQSANVDTVSGATFSSGGIIQAVKAALASAK